jgi:hypothetical protein
VCKLPNDLAFSCERTAMNSDQKMMLGAFVCCNGVLDARRAHSNAWGPTKARGCLLALLR